MGNGLGTDGINLPLHSTTKGVCKLMWARNVHTKCVRVTEMNAVVKKKSVFSCHLHFHDSECHRRYFPTRCVATVVHVVGARSTRRVYADLDTTPSGPPRLGGDPQGKDTKLWVLVFVAPRIATASMDTG